MNYGRKRLYQAVIGFFMMMVFFLCLNRPFFAGEDLHFDSEGNLVMTTYDRIATNNITYRTLGWTIKKLNKSRDAEGNFYAVIKMEQNGDVVIDPENPEYRYSEFICDKDTIFSRIGKASKEWQEDLYTNGGKVYLDAIMTVCLDGVPQGTLASDGTTQGEVYFTFSGIANAQPWSDKDPLKTHFDKEVAFAGNPKLLLKDCDYAVRHYECFTNTDSVYSLSRYGKDSQGKVEPKDSKIWNAADLSAYDFEYVKTKVTKYYKDGTSTSITDDSKSISFNHNNQAIVRVELCYYYKRKEHVEEISDTYHLKDGTVVSEDTFSIGAGKKGKEDFDVFKGIPSGENLYINGNANKIAYAVTYERHYGYKTLPIKYTSKYTYQWTDDEGRIRSEPVSKEEVYYVDREYSYWKIKSLTIYTLSKIEVHNYAFQGDKVTVNDVYSPDITVEYRERYIWRDFAATASKYYGVIQGCGDKSEIPKWGRQGEASAVPVYYQVANDTFSIDDEIFLAGNTLNSYTGNPKIGSDSGKIHVYRENLMIPTWKRNGKEYSSKAILIYKKYNNTQVQKLENSSVNSVSIHTPVVCSGFITDEKKFNQLCKPDEKRKSLILGRDFEIHISTKGQHTDQLGYGNRDYSKYVKAKQVKFPFSVYVGDTLHSKETWIDWKENLMFYLPTGVLEGNYTVEVRTLAYNYKEGDSFEYLANKELTNYIAKDTMDVYVCGRLYGLSIDNIRRPVWNEVFYEKGKKTDVSYTVGLHNLNGEKIKEDTNRTFPILQGGNPKALEEEGEPLGTEFHFTLDTIGNYDEEEGVEIEPVFYVTDKNGHNRRRVNIYQLTQEDGKVVWTNLFEDLVAGKRVLKKTAGSYIGSTARNVEDSLVAKNSVIRWNGNYCIPDEIFVVPYGVDIEAYIGVYGNITLTDKVFIRKGYLMVGFNIHSIKGEQHYLSYINQSNAAKGYANMWKIEGFVNPKLRKNQTEFALQYGDVFIYDLEKKLKDSHVVVGTH